MLQNDRGWLLAIVLLSLAARPSLAAVSVGTNLNVTKLAGNQTETTIAINPSNPRSLFVAANSGTFPTPGVFFYSTNGGASWRPSDVSALPTACCDEASAWDNLGNLFLTYLTVIGSTAAVGLSTNGGASFMLLHQSSINIDQPSIAAGPGGAYATGSVWITYASPSGLAAEGAAVSGFGVVGAFGAVQIAPGTGGSYGDIAVGPRGQVMVTYQNDTGSAGPATIYVNLDPDGLGPAPFNPALVAAGTEVGSLLAIPAQPKRKIDAEAGLAWDRTGGVRDGRIYLVYTDRPNLSSADTDIYVRFSDDQGTNWSAAIRVNDDPTGKSQLLPRIAIDQTTGDIAVSFLDCRNSANNNTVQLWATVSTDGGLAFAPNVKVSTGTSSALAVAVSTSGFDFGDYSGLAFNGGIFYPTWGDNSNSTGDNPEGTLHTLDVYTAAVRVPPTPPFLAIAATGSSNQVMISWPYPSPGFVLQQRMDLNMSNWANVNNEGSVASGYHQVSLSRPPGNQFFRLVRP